MKIKQIINTLVIFLSVISIYTFSFYYQNGLGLNYNDAKSHLDIGRRIVDGLKPGLAQAGSVWLPLPHLLMIPTIWNDFMWHSGLSGALISMISFVATGILIFKFLDRLKINLPGKLVGVGMFTANLNILYLQSTAMTELLLIATMMAGSYYLLCWYQEDDVLNLIKSAFWIMLSTLVRYDGWFLLLVSTVLVFLHTFKKKNYYTAEGTTILFTTLAGFGVALWLLWNLLIFKDPLYFAFGPYSAHAQQERLVSFGALNTKGNIFLSTQVYLTDVLYSTYTLPLLIAAIGLIVFILDPKIESNTKVASASLLSPLIFNIIALYLGHSVLFLPGIYGSNLFNVRYGVMVIPTMAVLIGYLVHRLNNSKIIIIYPLIFTLTFALLNNDAIVLDDAKYGLSHDDISAVSSWLQTNVANEPGFILVSAASHDIVMFSSGIPMNRFIHEGTGVYWEAATIVPDKWARWIITRTNDEYDAVWSKFSRSKKMNYYVKVGDFPFSDIYELRPEYLGTLNTEPIFKNQK